MPVLSQERLEAAEQAYIDQVIASRVGRPGALLGILEAVQEHNPHKYLSFDTLPYIASKTETPPGEGLQRGYVLLAVQPPTAGR